MSYLRLDKYLADAGYGTRSTVKEYIRKNRIIVDGIKVNKADIKIDTDKAVVCVDGRRIEYSQFEYFMLNKPDGVVSATTDSRDKTVLELITEYKRRDLFPVGRLDKDTEGLLLITNDGKLANNLLAPGKHVDKRYYAKVEGIVNSETVELFLSGVDIGDDTLTRPATLNIVETDIKNNISMVEITITEGRYHQIKRMFEAVGMRVVYLRRLTMGPVSLDESLKPGDYRKLTEQEITMLKQEAHLI